MFYETLYKLDRYVDWIPPRLPSPPTVPHAAKRRQPVCVGLGAVVKVSSHSVRRKLLNLLLLFWKHKHKVLQKLLPKHKVQGMTGTLQ